MEGETAPRALIVEDNPSELQGLASLVRSQGFEATCVRSLAEARRHLELATPDVLLCDLILPDGRGSELLDEIRDRDSTIKTLLITASVGCGDLRARRYLPKPVKVDTLIDFLARARRPLVAAER